MRKLITYVLLTVILISGIPGQNNLASAAVTTTQATEKTEATEQKLKEPTLAAASKTLYIKYKTYTVKIKNLTKDAKVTYVSSDAKVASVTSSGKVTPLVVGKTTITAKITQNQKTYTCKLPVTVKKPFIKITKKVDKLTLGETFHFEAKVYGSDNAVTWKVTSNNKTATINKSNGTFKAISEGTVTVTAAAGELQSTQKVTLSASSKTDKTVKKNELTVNTYNMMTVGETMEVSIYGLQEGEDYEVHFSDSSMATTTSFYDDSYFGIMALKAGKVTVEVTSDSGYGEATIVINELEVLGLKSIYCWEIGDYSINSKQLQDKVIWVKDDSMLETANSSISDNYVVRGIKIGDTILTAKVQVGGRTFERSINIRVEEAAEFGIAGLDEPILVGYTEHYVTDIRLPAEAVVEWSISDPSVATLTNPSDKSTVTGLVGLKPGTFTLTAKSGNTSATKVITVVNKAVELSLMTSTGYVGVGIPFQFDAYVSDPSIKPVWSVSDTNLATIDPATGKFVGLYNGIVTVIVSAAGKSDSCDVQIHGGTEYNGQPSGTNDDPEIPSNVLVYNGLEYQRNTSGGIVIVGITDDASENLVVPAKIDGKPVQAIANYALYNNDSIRSLVIEEGVSLIQPSAIGNLNHLETLVIPVSVTEYNGLIEGCENVKNLTVGFATVDHRFDFSPNLQTLTLLEGVKEVKSGAYAGKSSLTTLVIPDSLIKIGDNAFNATSVTNITISNDITRTVGKFVFYNSPVGGIGGAYKHNCISILTPEQKVTLEQILSIVNDYGMNYGSDEDKIYSVFDWIVNYLEYDYENYNNHTVPQSSVTVEGALVTKTAVCQGYSQTFKAFMDILNIPNYEISGEGLPSNEGHSWNLVNLNGKWYHIDATWGDANGAAYYLKSDANMQVDHSWEVSEYPQAYEDYYK